MINGNDYIHGKKLFKCLPLRKEISHAKKKRKEISRCSITIGTKGWFAKAALMAYNPSIFQKIICSCFPACTSFMPYSPLI
ncbi:unnamed protein product [Urochloa humidicola]